jgi:hypothetical protein
MFRTAAVAVLTALFPVAAQCQDMQWTYAPSIGETPMQTYLTLVYGVPQTDGVQALATCAIGANWVYADLLLATDVGGLSAGSTVSLGVDGNGHSAEYGAVVNRSDEGVTGVRLALPLDDPFWTALGGPAPITYGIPGYREALLQTDGARSPILGFRGDCENIADLRPPRPKR